MTITQTRDGYWLASGRFRGRRLLAEGGTRREALHAYWTLACEVQARAFAGPQLRVVR
jgi:hypothetical protein